MSAAAALRKSRHFPAVLGLGSFVAVLLVVELLIRLCDYPLQLGTGEPITVCPINKFIVPLPTEIIGAIPRIVLEEDVLSRFLMTGAQTIVAGILITVFGISGGMLLYRFGVLRQATEAWVAAVAAAPLVLIYPLYLVLFGRNATTIVMLAFTSALAPIILKTLEGLSGTRRVLIDVGRSLNLSRAQQFWKILLPAALPTIFVGMRLGLIFAMLNIVGVEYLINFGGLGQLINELAERYDLAGTYASICFVILVSIIVFILLERLERWLRPSA
jgi:NitT/TauT family transport system permease protein